ncbi:hypothetical protein SAMN05661096_01487 [Marivirga sericea]|uniref:Uncharacterized protein n=1 Tax=Marivirga sericea TaxID=1028 RepID=A0A1X7JAU0_9BACT|nr:hypothetical protein [Marivirga sericea]SMG24756.1 hypothetical protein SAMN05661096_01487 [Marivirga sericea]
MENLELNNLDSNEILCISGGDKASYDFFYALGSAWDSVSEWAANVDAGFSPDSPIHGTNPSHFM